MIIAGLIILLVIASVLFHLYSPWWTTPIATNWTNIDSTLSLTFWLTGVAFVLVISFLGWCVWRYRHHAGRVAHYEPESGRLEIWLGAITAVGVVFLLAPGLIAWGKFINPPADAATVEIVGQQWAWYYRLPGPDGKLGRADARFVTADNPLGVNPYDPNSKGNLIVNGGDLHLPVNKPVKILLRSIDVIHNFYIPEFRAKMDMLPGSESYFWFTPTKTGTFEILCAAYCGVGHSYMRGNVVIESDDDYQKWIAQQQSFTQARNGAGDRVRAAARGVGED
ncbi:cytochrome c oxidase subunit 2 [Rhodoblastus acidophilus]|uniref:cytochrome c oxidase subunit II n=1 Tax=Rhodoblastus acidophilus TaxID=1074 RepID=UPI0022254D4C|nr:cytochrome c oxidase subunit II [Rhodoblastus acidophilus]MCW2318238.1 cytochrome c oxidase subunit 2 [Rhodoblastus acidophilus]